MNTPQFDLGAMLSAPQTAIQQIPCDQLKPYHNHKFELYSGERLEDMVASIKENGVLSPIIVQPTLDDLLYIHFDYLHLVHYGSAVVDLLD